MRLAVAGLVAASLLVAGCGNGRDARRHALNAYIERVNAVENAAAIQWRHVQTSYATIGRGALTEKKLAALDRAPGEIRKLHAKLSAIPAPADARRLRASLLRLLAGDAEVAQELATFGRYVTAVAPLERALTQATKSLQKALKAQKKRAGQEQVLEVFARQVEAIASRQAALHPPPALVPWAREQLQRAALLHDGAEAVRNGIAHRDAKVAAEGLTKLRDGAAQQGVSAADRDAIAAYDARVVRMRKLAAAVAREQHRLSTEFV